MAEIKPKIRFQGYEDEWQETTLGKMGNTYNGLSGKTKDDFNHGDAQFVTYMNVFSNPVSSPTGVEHVEIDSTQNEVKKGDILFTTSSETPDEVGMSSVWMGNTPNTYLNSFCFGYRPNVEIEPYFSAYLMRSPKIRKEFYFLAQGISRFNISKQKAMDISTALPNIQEQQKIGDFFKELDELILAKEQELEKLKQLKAALLDNMFPNEQPNKQNWGGYNSMIINILRNNNLVYSQCDRFTPCIRFRGFKKPWESKRLDNIVTLCGGMDYKHLSEGDIPVYGTGGYMLSVNEALSEKKDAIGIGRKGTIDKPFILYAPFWTVDTLFYAIPSEETDLHFCYSLFQKIDWKKHDESTGVPSLSKNNINAILATVTTDITEQRMIGDFFRKQDETITNTQHQIVKLRNIKQACLQQMYA